MGGGESGAMAAKTARRGMSHSKGILVVSVLALIGAGAGALSSCSDQPPPRCQAGRGGWSAKYTQTSGPDAGPCVLPGEALFIETYNPPPSQLSPASVAIEGAKLGGRRGAVCARIP